MPSKYFQCEIRGVRGQALLKNSNIHRYQLRPLLCTYNSTAKNILLLGRKKMFLSWIQSKILEGGLFGGALVFLEVHCFSWAIRGPSQ